MGRRGSSATGSGREGTGRTAALRAADLRSFAINGRTIAYRLREGRDPTLVFLPGYASDMEGTKAVSLDRFAGERGCSMLRLDYSGTGSSSGDFADGTLSSWLEEALFAIDNLTTGPLVIIGSSMGGWIALHLALLRPFRTTALVGIAAAPDFTEWGFSDSMKERLLRHGRIEEPNPYAAEPQLFTCDFFQSGQKLKLLDKPIAVDCPVRLLHGDKDEEVPLDVSFRLVRALRSADVQLNILKGGNHRLSEPHEIRAILDTLDALLEASA